MSYVAEILDSLRFCLNVRMASLSLDVLDELIFTAVFNETKRLRFQTFPMLYIPTHIAFPRLVTF